MANDRLQEAADWWLQLREPNVPPETIAKWMHWCDARAENLEAFESVQALWQKAGSAPLKPVEQGILAEEKSGKRAMPWALAAGLAAVVAGTLYFFTVSGESGAVPLAERAEASTPVGDIRELTLPDGSQVTLGAASELATAFTPERRIVRLERGEAFFKVEKDARRPFVVMASNAAVTAIGTAFNVRADAGALKVTVAEGIVEVGAESGASGSHSTVRVRAGEEVDLSGGRAGEAVAPAVRRVDPDVAASWTTGALKFMDEPLSVVVATVNRYSRTAIELEEEELKEFRYTGTVVAGRIDEWLAALPNAFPVEIDRQGQGRVRIESRNR